VIDLPYVGVSCVPVGCEHLEILSHNDPMFY